MLAKFTELFKKNKKSLLWISAFFVLFFLDFDISFADAETDKEIIAKANFLIGLLNIVMKIVSALMAIMTSFVSLFLQPTWVNGSILSLDLYLKEIWRLVANTVYVIFAFLLIVIAFANIIGKGQDKFALKQALPKFIIGVLIVPASWFIVQFMISLSGVLTVSALTIPFDTFEDRGVEAFGAFLEEEKDGKKPLLDSEICVKYFVNLGSVKNKEEAIMCKDKPRTNSDGSAIDPDQSARLTVKEILFQEGDAPADGSSIYGIIGLYTFGIIGIEQLDNIDGAEIVDGAVTDIFAFLGKLILSLVFVIVYFVLLVALFAALFVRILRIWIFIMLSPLFGLMYFFGKGVDKFNFKEFFALVMTPVYVGLALSFGFLFMMVASHGLKDLSGTVDEDKITPITIGIFELELGGAMSESSVKLKKGDNDIKVVDVLKPFKGAGGALGQLVVYIFGIGMFWIAVMAALKQSEITKAIIQPIEQFGNQVGKLAASAPMYAPIIPTGKGMTSAAGIGNLANRGFAAAGNYKVKEGQKLGEQFGILDKAGAGAITSASKVAKNNLKIYDAKSEGFTNEIKKATFIEGATLDSLSNNEAYLELINEALKKIGSKFEANKGSKSDIAEALRQIDGHREGAGGSGVFRGLSGIAGTLNNNDVENAIQAGIAERKTNGDVSDLTNRQLTVKALQGEKGNKIDMNIINESNIKYDTSKQEIISTDGSQLSADMNKFIAKINNLRNSDLGNEESISEALTDLGINKTIAEEIDAFFKDKVYVAPDSDS